MKIKENMIVKFTNPYPNEVGCEFKVVEIFPHTIGERNFFTVKLQYICDLTFPPVQTIQINSEDELTIIRS